MIDFPYSSSAASAAPRAPIRFGEGLTSQDPGVARAAAAQPGRAFEAMERRASARRRSRTSACRSSSATRRSARSASRASTRRAASARRTRGCCRRSPSNVGTAIRNAQLYREAQRRATEMAELAEVGREISATLDLDGLLERIAERAQELLEVDTSAVFLAEPDGQAFRAIVASSARTPSELKADPITPGRGDHRRRRRREPGRDRQRRRCTDPRAVPIAGTPTTHDEERLMVAPLIGRERRQRHDGRLAAGTGAAVHAARPRLPRRAVAAGRGRHRQRAAVRRGATRRARRRTTRTRRRARSSPR